MALIQYKENTRTRRFASKIEKPAKTGKRIKSLTVLLPKKSGRSHGKISVRHQGGRHKRLYRIVDFKRNQFGVMGTAKAFEYDPNRNVDLVLIEYKNGEKSYILRPVGLKLGDTVVSGERVEVKTGNAMKLKNIPVGTPIHNVELIPGKGGQLGRSAGTRLVVQAKEGGWAHLKMPSNEIRMVSLESLGTIGSLSNEDWKNINFGKAGRKRHMGIRPAVRGVAMDPASHAHGGGEGRSGIGRKKPMTKYGRPAVGKTRNKTKWTNKYIVKRRK